jgi:hypothetical protein
MNEPELYEICVWGCLADSWSDWFEGLALRRVPGLTILTGYLDQAALFGVLARIGNLGLKLRSVRHIGGAATMAGEPVDAC